MKYRKIVCPFCEAEYLPAEIYYPNSLLGKPSNIVKDEHGKILSFLNDSMDVRESYVCDYCNKTFNVKMEYSFNIEKDEFSEEYEQIVML